ncbi:MAG: MGMT family protein [Thiothrix sp.]
MRPAALISSAARGRRCANSTAKRAITRNRLKRSVSRRPRAIGTANGQNPISILIPCHRVIVPNQQAGWLRRRTVTCCNWKAKRRNYGCSSLC